MLSQSHEPGDHDKELDDNPDQVEILEMLVFEERGKPEYMGKNLLEQSRDYQQQVTQATYDTESGNRTRDNLVGGERSHQCTKPATRKFCSKQPN